MALDPYKVLGVDRSASEAEIKKAHRRKAKDLHPDQNPDDAKKLEEFKHVSQAWDILGDKEKRAKFDRGEAVINLLGGKDDGRVNRDLRHTAKPVLWDVDIVVSLMVLPNRVKEGPMLAALPFVKCRRQAHVRIAEEFVQQRPVSTLLLRSNISD